MGAVFHAYDRLHLETIPRRYTVEAGKSLTDEWLVQSDQGRYDLWVYGPNGFVRELRGCLRNSSDCALEVELRYDARRTAIEVIMTNSGRETGMLTVQANAYRSVGPRKSTVYSHHCTLLVAVICG